MSGSWSPIEAASGDLEPRFRDVRPQMHLVWDLCQRVQRFRGASGCDDHLEGEDCVFVGIC